VALSLCCPRFACFVRLARSLLSPESPSTPSPPADIFHLCRLSSSSPSSCFSLSSFVQFSTPSSRLPGVRTTACRRRSLAHHPLCLLAVPPFSRLATVIPDPPEFYYNPRVLSLRFFCSSHPLRRAFALCCIHTRSFFFDFVRSSAQLSSFFFSSSLFDPPCCDASHPPVDLRSIIEANLLPIVRPHWPATTSQPQSLGPSALIQIWARGSSW
jgi:hypothetical protein